MSAQKYQMSHDVNETCVTQKRNRNSLPKRLSSMAASISKPSERKLTLID